MTATELFDLSGKVAVITGGAGDIGAVYGRALCEAGASVVLADLDESTTAKIADELTARRVQRHRCGGRRGRCRLRRWRWPAPPSMPSEESTSWSTTPPIMRELPPYGLSNMPVDEWDRVIDVNLRGPLLCTQAVVPSMTERGGGRIINGLSAGAFMRGWHLRNLQVRTARLTANLASELGSRGINVNAIAAGAGRRRERLRQPGQGLAHAHCPRSRHSREEVGSPRGPRRHPAAVVFEGRRLDQRADDPRGRRLGDAFSEPIQESSSRYT